MRTVVPRRRSRQSDAGLRSDKNGPGTPWRRRSRADRALHIAGRGEEVIACHECGTVHRLPPCRTTRSRAASPAAPRSSSASSGRWSAHWRSTSPRWPCSWSPTASRSCPCRSAGKPTRARSWTAPWRSTTTTCGRWRSRWARRYLLPLAKILGMLAILVPLQLGLRPPWIVAGFRWVERLQPWAMMEVYLLGVIVAFVKLQDLADRPSRDRGLCLRRHDHPAGRRRCPVRAARDLAPARAAGACRRAGPDARHDPAGMRAMRPGGARRRGASARPATAHAAPRRSTAASPTASTAAGHSC